MEKFNIVENEGKTKEEALQKCLNELNVSQNEVFLRSEFIEGKLFKPSKYIVYALSKSEIKKFIEDYISNIGNLMNLKIETDILETENNFNVTLISDNNAILIGKEGKTLNAIQLILRQVVRNQINLNIKINIDVANYKVKKLKNIEYEVKKIANEVRSSKITAVLDPMNSFERRFVHNFIDRFSDLQTESIGEGKERRVTIKYIGE